jgi:hypothetical protein
MIWAVLALLGVPIWLIAGMLGVAFWSRRRFKRAPGVFRCKLRATSGDAPGIADHWPRASAYGRWVHDVLLVQKGVALVRTIPLPVTAASKPAQPADNQRLERLGDSPRVVTLQLDNRAIVELATSQADAASASGAIPASA